jgi:adenine phosphoribosyltransferase
MKIAEVEDSIKSIIKEKIRSVKDFPKPGIVFKDITPVLNDKHLLELTSILLAEPFRGMNVNHVAGLESRGFLFGTNLAQDLHAGFIPIRKPNKLPAETESVAYELEYGTDILEIHSDAIGSGASVIIHDDLIATGGTALAATKLVQMLGGNIIGYSFVMEIEELQGTTELLKVAPCYSLIKV